MLQGHAALGGGVHPALRHCVLACGRQAVVEASGQRAGVAVAGLVRVLAGLILGHQGQHAQRLAGQAGAKACQCLQRRQAARALASEVGDLVDALAGHGA